MGRIRGIASGGVLLTLAMVVGSGTAFAAFTWAQGVGSPGVGSSETVAVVVARDAIPAGTRLTEAVLEVRHVSKDAVVATPFSAEKEASGRTARYPLAAGEQVSESKLVSRAAPEGQGLAFSVPPGYRGVSIPIDEVSGVGGLLVPGDRVDVMVSSSYDRMFGPVGGAAPNNNDSSKPIVMTILQDILVVAVGQEITAPLDEGRDPATLRPDSAESQPKARSVTLAVQPNQSQALFMATQHGKVGVALRPYAERSQQALEPMLRLEAVAPNTNLQTSR